METFEKLKEPVFNVRILEENVNDLGGALGMTEDRMIFLSVQVRALLEEDMKKGRIGTLETIAKVIETYAVHVNEVVYISYLVATFAQKKLMPNMLLSEMMGKIMRGRMEDND